MKQYEHGGNVWQLAEKLKISTDEIADLSSCVSPYIPEAADIFVNGAPFLSVLPEPHSSAFSKKYSRIHGAPADCVLLTAGTTEAIFALCFLYRGQTCGIFTPAYSDYERCASACGMDIRYIPAGEEQGFLHDYHISADTPADIYFICHPNNPTGRLAEKQAVLDAVLRFPDSLFVVDESYIGFTAPGEQASLRQNPPANVVVLRSYSKVFGVPGARIGYMVASPEIVSAVKAVISPWSVSTLGQRMAELFLTMPEIPVGVLEHKEEFHTLLRDLSGYLAPLRSDTHFALCALRGVSSSVLAEKCALSRILIRDCRNIRGLDDRFIRIGMGRGWRENIRKIGTILDGGLK